MKSVTMLSQSDRIRMAAQADLVLLTIEMLQPIKVSTICDLAAWWQCPLDDYLSVIAVFAPERTGYSAKCDTNPASVVAFANVINIENLPTLNDAFEEVYKVANNSDCDSWSNEYWRMFEGSQACPINQASYIRRDKGAILGDLAGFYAAFGWQSNPDNGERPDHLVTQLAFVAMLLTMASRAESSEQADVALNALRDFAKCHMHDWLPSVCQQMIEATRVEYYGAVAQWLTLLWMNLSTQNDWNADTSASPMLSPVLDPEDPYECGAPDLVNISINKGN